MVYMPCGKRQKERTIADRCVFLILLALPVVFAHCGMIRPIAMVMSIVGGLLIYGTIISFTMFFTETEEF